LDRGLSSPSLHFCSIMTGDVEPETTSRTEGSAGTGATPRRTPRAAPPQSPLVSRCSLPPWALASHEFQDNPWPIEIGGVREQRIDHAEIEKNMVRAPDAEDVHCDPASPMADENMKAPQGATAFRRLACERHMS